MTNTCLRVINCSTAINGFRSKVPPKCRYQSSIPTSVTMQSIGNASGNMARLSYTSTSSCDSYSAYHHSKAGKFFFSCHFPDQPSGFKNRTDASRRSNTVHYASVSLFSSIPAWNSSSELQFGTPARDSGFRLWLGTLASSLDL